MNTLYVHLGTTVIDTTILDEKRDLVCILREPDVDTEALARLILNQRQIYHVDRIILGMHSIEAFSPHSFTIAFLNTLFPFTIVYAQTLHQLMTENI